MDESVPHFLSFYICMYKSVSLGADHFFGGGGGGGGGGGLVIFQKQFLFLVTLARKISIDLKVVIQNNLAASKQ